MHRLCLVLFVCLGVQLNAASAPFLHMHADGAHHAAQNAGAVVHRHLTAHATADTDHHADDAAPAMGTTAGPVSIESADVQAPLTFGALAARLAPAGAAIAAPTGVVAPVVLPRPAVPPDADVGDALPDSPGARSSSHRGPPR